MLDQFGLHIRAAFFRLIRSFFHQQGFLEVDTPLRQPFLIPESNILPLLSENQYLQTSPELCMKRLLANGCDKIFQICHCFRKGESGRLHLEEFQMLEWYRSGKDYKALMIDCEDLLRFIQRELQSSIENRFPDISMPELFSGIDLYSAWPRLTVAEAFARYSPAPLDQVIAGGCFDEVLVEHVEPHLGFPAPVFLCDYPVQFASLARKKNADPFIAERFELYCQGIELANGFSELTDNVEQRTRFQQEIDVISVTRDCAVEMPERFLEDLGKLETAAGIAFGVDRLFMLALGFDEISRAVTFSPDDFR